MAEMTPSKHPISEFNGGTGQEYGVQAFPISDVVMAVENSAYSAEIADGLTQSPDLSEIDNVGTPSVSFVDGEVVNGVQTKKFKFANLKGDKGDKGDKGETGDAGVMDNQLSSTSTNGVQNKVLYQEFQNVVHKTGNETISGTKQIDGTLNIGDNGLLYLTNNTIVGTYANVKYQGSSNSARDVELIVSHDNNYIKYGSGLCIQTGTISTTGNASYTITLPIAMPSNNYMVFASGINYASNKLTMGSHLVSQTTTQFEISLSYNTDDANYPTSSTYRWVAICLPISSGFIGG